jgi:hypothetical protein
VIVVDDIFQELCELACDVGGPKNFFPIRPGAESLVNTVSNPYGARRSRRKTEKRTHLQLVFPALSFNIRAVHELHGVVRMKTRY